MNVLIACEESQTVCKEFRKLGHNAFSCDIIDHSGNNDDWHIKQDVLPLLDGNCEFQTVDGLSHKIDGKWDMIIAFPPCFAEGTLVLTKNGYKKISDIEIGDYVLTHLGNWKKVYKTMKHYSLETLEVNVRGSNPIITTKEHPFYFRKRINKRYPNGSDNLSNYFEPKFEQVDNIKNGDKIGMVLPPTILCDYDDEMLWLMGRYVADGYLRKRNNQYQEVHFYIGNKKIEYFEEKVYRKHKVKKANDGCLKVSMYGKDFCKEFSQFGRNCYEKELPHWVLSLEEEKAKVFLDGYLSGDGYINKKRISCTSSSKKLILGLSILFRRVFKVPFSIKEINRESTTIIEGRKVNQNTQWTLYCSNSIENKNLKYQGIVDGEYTWNSFKNKKRMNGCYVYNISVEDDESYIVENCIVHNCTDLCVSGARHFAKKIADGTQQRSIDFFMKFANADCDKIVIENPVGIMSTHYKKPTQIIQPWQFGDNVTKTTCLWLKGVEELIPSETEQPEIEYFEWISKDGKKKRQAKWYMDALKLPAKERARVRSKTFNGIAVAMAEQWGK